MATWATGTACSAPEGWATFLALVTINADIEWHDDRHTISRRNPNAARHRTELPARDIWPAFYAATLSEALYPTHQCIRRLHGSQLNWHGQGGLRYRLLVQSLGTQWQRRPHITAVTLWHELDVMMIVIPEGSKFLIADKDGFVTMSAEGMAKHFAQDVPAAQTRIMAVSQGPVRGKNFEEKVTVAAWETRPSWFVLSEQVHMIQPALQAAMVKKISAHVVKLPTSHVPQLSRPRQVADAIIAAALQPSK